MYTRSYSDDIGDMIIPEKYGGTSFGQSVPHETRSDIGEGGKNPWENEELHTTPANENGEAEPVSATPSKLSLSGIMSGIFKNGTFSLQKLGKEELLIIATAAFLFFSKEGDRECAIMLILLLFLN